MDTNLKVELLAPAGNMEKMKTAFHFGADAVYLSGKNYGLRAYADNFTDEEIEEAAEYAHSINKKVYVTLNIFASESDFVGLKGYLKVLEEAKVDAVLVSDAGIFSFVRQNSGLKIHVSTQANTTNKYAVKFWSEQGAERVVLAREVPLEEIRIIKSFVGDCELECFVHGAMCISYSGRCLMSNYLTGRDGNRGECVQACRWKWEISQTSDGEKFTLNEDERGSYIFNSKDLNMLRHVGELLNAGVSSFKIEGRMKSVFYVATAVNAYRRAIDAYLLKSFDEEAADTLYAELEKASHRKFTTGFYLPSEEPRQYYESSKADEQYIFAAVVKSYKEGAAVIEQRNRFCEGDILEILSPSASFMREFQAVDMKDCDGKKVNVADKVQQAITLPCPFCLEQGDVLRIKKL